MVSPAAGQAAKAPATAPQAAPAKAPAPAAAKPAAAKPAAAPAAAPKKPAAAKARPIDQIKKMVSLKMPEAAILNQIKNVPGGITATADELIELKTLGAPDSVILALSGGGVAETAPAAAPAAAAAKAPAAAVPAARPAWNTDLSTIKCEAPPVTRKRVIAVDEIDFGTVQRPDEKVFGTNVDVGKGIQALFVKRLVEQGKFTVVERRLVKDILKEQDFAQSSRVKRGTGARTGRITGADAILMGTITIFGRDDKRKGIGGFGGAWPWAGLAKFKWGSDKFVLGISYRLVDAETSEIIEQGEARGEAQRKSKGLDGAAYWPGAGGGGGYTDEQRAAQVIVGEATIDCVDKLGADLNSKEEKIPRKSWEVETRIAEISGPQIYLAAGSNDGVNKCDRFEVFRVVKEIIEPTTKEVIDFELQRTGELLVTEVRERVAIGAYSGTEAPEVKFLVKRKAAGQ
jgi:curli biogenesis system outer membrane secretion channel CsgG